ncbi:hypothetical protein LXL04_034793 [Taraxacum kok-saghyz]
MEGGFVLDDKPKVEKTAMDSTGPSGRKMLADISNMQRKNNTIIQDKKSLPNSASQKDYIEQLQKENTALKKLLADKSKIIDLSGNELHKLRVNLQKMQQQNLQLAKSNSQILAELNSGKDRLKDLQHQLGCKNGIIIARQLELEGKRKTKTCQTNDIKKVKVSENEEKGVCIDNTSRRQKSKSLGPSVGNGVGDNRSIKGRRQSARSKRDVDLPACPLREEDRMKEDNDTIFVVKKEDVEIEGDESIIPEGSRRSSISRPSRQAVKKIQSYKEMSLNVKMRRTE